jgi:hypothetical protein
VAIATRLCTVEADAIDETLLTDIEQSLMDEQTLMKLSDAA